MWTYPNPIRITIPIEFVLEPAQQRPVPLPAPPPRPQPVESPLEAFKPYLIGAWFLFGLFGLVVFFHAAGPSINKGIDTFTCQTK